MTDETFTPEPGPFAGLAPTGMDCHELWGQEDFPSPLAICRSSCFRWRALQGQAR
jgi:hypothetical protein